jgi:hypothetical protein
MSDNVSPDTFDPATASTLAALGRAVATLTARMDVAETTVVFGRDTITAIQDLAQRVTALEEAVTALIRGLSANGASTH